MSDNVVWINAQTSWASDQGWYCGFLILQTEYLVIRTSNRMQLMELFFFVLFWGSCEYAEGILHDLHTKNDLLAVEARWVLHRRTSYEETNVSFIIFLMKAILCSALEKHDWLVCLCDLTAFLLTSLSLYIYIYIYGTLIPSQFRGKLWGEVGWRQNSTSTTKMKEKKGANQTVCVWIHTERLNRMDTGNWN